MDEIHSQLYDEFNDPKVNLNHLAFINLGMIDKTGQSGNASSFCDHKGQI